MSDFDRAIPVILAHEGGFADHPADPGGITNHGISLRFALRELAKDADGDGRLDGDVDGDGDVDADDIRKFSRDRAAEAYRRCFWDRYGYGRIVDQVVATKVCDMSVNMGGAQAHKLAQRAAVACGEAVVVDGALGPQSVAALNRCEPRELLLELCFQQQRFYQGLVMRKPSLVAFATGWAKRAGWPFTEAGAYTGGVA